MSVTCNGVYMYIGIVQFSPLLQIKKQNSYQGLKSKLNKEQKKEVILLGDV